MEILTHLAAPLLTELAVAFTRSTFQRFTLLMASAILTTGHRTVANLLRTLGPLAPGDPASYRRVLCQARWHSLRLQCRLTRLVIALVPNDATVVLVGDDTAESHPGRKVFGKAKHRDAVRSSHSYTAFLWGHRWIVLAVLVQLPGTTRPWALPMACLLYRSRQDNQAAGRKHRTPVQLMRHLLRRVRHWLPDRTLLFVGDGGYGTHELSRWIANQPGLEMVSKLHPQANLFDPPPAYSGRGRPRVKGAPRPKPSQAVAATTRLRRLEVAWYGGGRRQVRVTQGTGHWYKAGEELVKLRWVYVRDDEGTHRDEYFYTTDLTLSASAIIEKYAWRWNLETTFQECREHLGFGTTRGRSEPTVQRAGPCLLGLYSVVAWLFIQLPESQRVQAIHWDDKTGLTFSDALTAVRRQLWSEGVFPQVGLAEPIKQLTAESRDLLLAALTTAA